MMKKINVQLYRACFSYFLLVWCSIAAYAQSSYTPPFLPPLIETDGLQENTYVKLRDGVSVYDQPSEEGWIVLTTQEDNATQYVSVIDEIETEDGTIWYQVNENEYVRKDDTRMTNPSTFEGVYVMQEPVRRFGWILTDKTQLSLCPGCTASPYIPKKSRYDFVQIYETAVIPSLDEEEKPEIWHNIGGGLWLREMFLGIVPLIDRPYGITEDEKWVAIDLYQQTFTAYIGDQMVYASLISSGESEFPTREGTFTVWKSYDVLTMSGWYNTPEYYLIEDVPNSLFFDNSIALHGAYWHDRFGYTNSHGCVNVPPKDAKWLYDWSLDTPEMAIHVHSSKPESWGDVVKNNELTSLLDQLSTERTALGIGR